MSFKETFEDNFYDNMKSIQYLYPSLYEKLMNFSENIRFDVIFQDTGIINIFDKETNRYLYTDPLQDVLSKLDSFKELCFWPYIYFFGFGNGLLCKLLLKHHSLFVIEPNIELLFIALHTHDFSEEINSRRLVLIHYDELTLPYFVNILHKRDAVYYVKSYTLFDNSDYYSDIFSTEMISANQKITEYIDFVICNAGNCVIDSLIGLKNHILNIPMMVKKTQFQEFRTLRNSETVIMISTGPSLTKQLPLLKEIAPYATLIAADSALRILVNHNIVPDICVSLERTEHVVNLFKDLPMAYKKKIVFVRSSVEDQNIFPSLKNCSELLVMRPYDYNHIFGLDSFGYLCAGMSVANMAHELSAYMGFKTCIIIGQDLAFGEKGRTHSAGHINGEFDEGAAHGGGEVAPAYGGNGVVTTTITWNLFRNGLVQTVNESKHFMKTVNATEGGARIEGTEELSFSDAIQRYVKPKKRKKKIHIQDNDNVLAANFYKIYLKNMKVLLREGSKIQQKIENVFLILATECKKLESKTVPAQLMVFSDDEIIKHLDLITELRGLFETNHHYKTFYWELVQPLVIHHEIELGAIKSMYIRNPSENKHKAIRWIYNHMLYLFNIAGSIDNIIKTLKEALAESEENFSELVDIYKKNSLKTYKRTTS